MNALDGTFRYCLDMMFKYTRACGRRKTFCRQSVVNAYNVSRYETQKYTREQLIYIVNAIAEDEDDTMCPYWCQSRTLTQMVDEALEQEAQ